MLQHHKINRLVNLTPVSEFLSLQLLCKKDSYLFIGGCMHLSMDIHTPHTPPSACGGQSTTFGVTSLLLPSESPGSNLGSPASLQRLLGPMIRHHLVNSHLIDPDPSFLVIRWKLLFGSPSLRVIAHVRIPYLTVIAKSFLSTDLIDH